MSHVPGFVLAESHLQGTYSVLVLYCYLAKHPNIQRCERTTTNYGHSLWVRNPGRVWLSAPPWGGSCVCGRRQAACSHLNALLGWISKVAHRRLGKK